MHQDKFTVSFANLPHIPKEDSKAQEYLTKGYKLYYIDGSCFAEKNGEKVEIKDSR